ncbi:MAG: hypothetical protein IJ529_03000 [Alphaproteobacteria bacterium]|nr:hypothetical protein [Alphaproteobacteria bacterium]MBQ9245350.1 hypothetical protein [bacterium]
MFNNNNNYNSQGVPSFMAYGSVPVGLPKGAVPQNATGGAVPQWALGKQNPTSPFGQPTQLAQNNTQANDGSTNISSNSSDDIFNRVLNKTLGEEGGYESRADKIDTPTNMGFQQATLDRFKAQHPDLSQGYPENVKDLTYSQGKLIARKDYFDKYRIGEINHQPLQETMFDSFFNHSPQAPALWAQKAINKNTNMNIAEDGIFGSETINAMNSLSPKEIINVNNSIIDQRLADYESEKQTNPNPYYSNYTIGLPQRFDRFRIK